MDGRNDRGRVGRIAWIVGGLAALALAGLAAAIFAPTAPVEALPLTFAIAAVAAATGAYHQGTILRRRADKVSSEIDTLSTRLLRLETRITEPAPPPPAVDGLSTAVAEVTGEIALLGGLVRDLAVTVATQDRDVASLKNEAERAKAQAPAAAPPLVPKAALVAVPAADVEQRARERAVIPSILPLQQPPQAAPARAHAPPQQPQPQPLVREARPASDGPDIRRVAAIMDALQNDRIELHLQPVVSLPQRKSVFYEVLARVRLADDTILVPAEFLPILERSGFVVDFDRKVLTRAASIARHLAGRGSESRVSCNLSPESLQGGVLRAAARISEAYPDVCDRLILEISQRCWRELDADTAGTIALLRNRGLVFALDRATDLRLDPLALAERGVSYVKLPADLLLQAEAGRGLDVAVGDLATVLTRAGIRLVAERVEREEDVPNLIDLDVPLAQGFVFAPPRAIRPEVLTPAQAAASAAGGAPEQQAAPAPEKILTVPPAPADGEERRPFRQFLRRAG